MKYERCTEKSILEAFFKIFISKINLQTFIRKEYNYSIARTDFEPDTNTDISRTDNHASDNAISGRQSPLAPRNHASRVPLHYIQLRAQEHTGARLMSSARARGPNAH